MTYRAGILEPLLLPAVPSRHAANFGTPGTGHPDTAVPRCKAPEALIFRDTTDVGTPGTSGTCEIETACFSSDIVFDAEADCEFEERAAISEDGTGAPAEWVEGFARNVARPPKDFSPVGRSRLVG